MSRWKNNQEGQERAARISRAGGSASRRVSVRCFTVWPLRTVGFWARVCGICTVKRRKEAARVKKLIPWCPNFQTYSRNF